MCHWDNVIATVHLANADLVLLSCRPSDKLNVLHLWESKQVKRTITVSENIEVTMLELQGIEGMNDWRDGSSDVS